MRVLGLNAIGGQFLPPHSDGQKSAVLPVPGLCVRIDVGPAGLRDRGS